MNENIKTHNFKDVLEKDGVLVYTNKGISMRPLLRQGKDVMVIKKLQPPYKKYDAVLFIRSNGQYVLHRILKVNNDSYFIIGDNCVTGENIKENQIIGVLTAVKRNGKTINSTDKGYRFFVVLWWKIFPLRKIAKYFYWFLLKQYSRAVKLVKIIIRKN